MVVRSNMPTLLLRFASPLQSWGCNSKFEIRTTEKMPTKSGTIGFLAAALGLKRDADLSKLNSLRFGVRVDREGEVIRDFHTAHGKKDYVTYRYYLCDAVFLVGLEGDEDVLNELKFALKNPRFSLFLGRRSCPPTLPVFLEISNNNLEDALSKTKPLCDIHNSKMRVQIEPIDNDGGMVQDMPVSFSPFKRVYGYRKAKEYFVNADNGEHDPMAELG